MAKLGIGYALYYEMTGDRSISRAAIGCGNALAAHVRSGDDTQTPWPFRVNGRTGATLDGETFGGIVVSPLRLFDELIRIHRVTSTRTSAHADWPGFGWTHTNSTLTAPPMTTGAGTSRTSRRTRHVNQAAPTYTALYLLNLPDPGAVDPQWRTQVST